MHVRVFVLAGQSNMVGMASIDHLVNVSRDDSSVSDIIGEYPFKTSDSILIKYQENFGNLTVSTKYAGSRNQFGVEVGFGFTLDDNHPTLLIKTAWGGKTLAVDFRSPSSGTGNYKDMRPLDYGVYYRAMIEDVLATTANIQSFIPTATSFSIDGLVWFQGWNDHLDTGMVQEYGQNLENFIRDVRLDLNASFPIIVGELGMHGVSPSGRGTDRVLRLRATQRAVCDLDEFKSNTKFVKTQQYAVLDPPHYNGIHHYFGRADTYFHMGVAFGKAMMTMIESKASKEAQKGDHVSVKTASGFTSQT